MRGHLKIKHEMLGVSNESLDIRYISLKYEGALNQDFNMVFHFLSKQTLKTLNNALNTVIEFQICQSELSSEALYVFEGVIVDIAADPHDISDVQGYKIYIHSKFGVLSGLRHPALISKALKLSEFTASVLDGDGFDYPLHVPAGPLMHPESRPSRCPSRRFRRQGDHGQSSRWNSSD